MSHRWNSSHIAAVLVSMLAVLVLYVGAAACSSGEAETSTSTGSSFSDVGDSPAAGTSEATSAASPGGMTDAEIWASQQLANMTTEEKVAQLFLVRPEAIGYDAVNGSYDDLASCYSAYPVGGLVYFKPDLETPEQARRALADAHAVTGDGIPLLLAADEEGGTSTRIAGRDGFGVEDIGDTGDPQGAYDAACYLSGYLLDYGFNVDLAPVLDITDDPEDMIYDRSFGADPELVAAMGEAAVRGFNDSGIICCPKHFPGIGEAAGGDSHENIVVNNASHDELFARELVPYQRVIAAGVPMIMVGHVAVPALTGSDTQPASLSSAIMTDLLRGELGFDGVIITDSLEMGGATDSGGSGEVCVSAFLAGADMLLIPADFNAAYDAMLAAVNDGTISQERLDESVMRILVMKYPLHVEQEQTLAAAA